MVGPFLRPNPSQAPELATREEYFEDAVKVFDWKLSYNFAPRGDFEFEKCFKVD
jgi:hypothetical protein